MHYGATAMGRWKWEFFILTCANTPNRFFGLFSHFSNICFSYFFIWVIWELRELCAKFWNSMIKIHGQIISQSWPLLNPFYSGPIVQCTDKYNHLWALPKRYTSTTAYCSQLRGESCSITSPAHFSALLCTFLSFPPLIYLSATVN